jgi:ribose 5-phosphate isomerase B
MGARIIAPQLGCMLVEQWLDSDFEGGGSTAKVERIKEYEQEHQSSRQKPGVGA